MAQRFTRISRWILLVCILALPLAAALSASVPASADGGPMVDPDLFTQLKESQQVAVVRIKDGETAQVDLFVSILDQTGESHDITYFVPLGYEADKFNVTEQYSGDFNNLLTRGLDQNLFSASQQSADIVHGLFAGALLGNGAILAPLWVPLFFSGCESGQAPVESFSTPSSTVSVYDINQTTDIQALISTTGLDPSVTDTLNSLQGQQIAVIKMKTVAQSADGSSSSAATQGEPGLHLSWLTALSGKSGSSVYTYPLGTGAAWSQPIELTRVYIVAPVDFSLSIDYPKLGTALSGYTRQGSTYAPRIAQAGQTPAYAVERAYNASLDSSYDVTTGTVTPPENVNIWRISYANSNAKDNIEISVKPGAWGGGLSAWLRQGDIFASFLIGLIAAALFWLLSWYLLMPRLLRHSVKRNWYQPLIYLGINFAMLIFPGLLFLVALSLGAAAMALVVSAVIFGGVGILIFVFVHMDRMGVSRGVAIRSFIIVTLASNAAYLLFALGYAKLVGAI